MAAEYDYGNARLRAMKSRLLARKELDALVEAGNLQGFISVLVKTAYRKPLETALARTTGIECVAEALHIDLATTLGNLRRFFSGVAGERVAILLRSYDVHNLKAILRGLSKNAAAAEILAILLPVGELDYETLAELARAPAPRAAIDLMASMALPHARPLLQLRAERPGADTPEMEFALDQWHFRDAQATLKAEAANDELLAMALDLDADIANLITALRFARAPSERNLLRERLNVDQVRYLFVGPGRLSFTLLSQAAEQDALEVAVEVFAGTPYERPLREGLALYAQSGRLSDIEKKLRRFRLEWAAGLVAKDPLGIGVPLGYLALKTNEVSNLRWIAQGIHLGLSPETIRAEVEYVP